MPRSPSRIALLALFGSVLSGVVPAQVTSAQPTTTSVLSVAPSAAPEIELLAKAMASTRAAITADRLVHEASYTWGLREQVWLEGAPGRRFAAKLVSILDASSLSSTEVEKRAASFDRHAGFLWQYHGFRIADANTASQSYRFVTLCNGSFLGRPTTWVALLTVYGGRSSWLLQLDNATGYPVYQGEYDAKGRLVFEYIMRTFQAEGQAQIPNDIVWWKPTLYDVQDFRSPELAMSALAAAKSTPLSPHVEDLPPGYSLAASRVSINQLNGDKTLVFDFSDGIDHIFLTESETAPLPVTGQTGHQMFVYSDLTETECMFQVDSLRFVAIGRGSRDTIQQFAKDTYVRALQPR